MVDILITLGKGSHFYKKSGFHYSGQWLADKRHGYGTLSAPTDKSGSRLRKLFAGSWSGDEKHGNGNYFFADGSTYGGGWVSDMRQGWGRMIYADGSIYEGEWYREKRHGQGISLLSKELLN